MKITFESIGWVSKVAQKRATFSISIFKPVALGNCLEKGQHLYCYSAKDEHKRPIVVVYLDGKQRISGKGMYTKSPNLSKTSGTVVYTKILD